MIRMVGGWMFLLVPVHPGSTDKGPQNGCCVWILICAFSTLTLFVGGRKGIWPVKTDWWGIGMVICLEWGANNLHMVQLMPLPPHHLLLQQNTEGFTFLLPTYPGCPGKRPLNGCNSLDTNCKTSRLHNERGHFTWSWKQLRKAVLAHQFFLKPAALRAAQSAGI